MQVTQESSLSSFLFHATSMMIGLPCTERDNIFPMYHAPSTVYDDLSVIMRNSCCPSFNLTCISTFWAHISSYHDHSISLCTLFLISLRFLEHRLALLILRSSIEHPLFSLPINLGLLSKECQWTTSSLGNVTGYPGVFQSNLCLYPSKPIPMSTGTGFCRYR